MYMPSPYNALVRSFLKHMEAGTLSAADLEPMLGPDSVLHAPTAGEENVDHVGVEAFASYFAGLRAASGDTLEYKPQSFELRDRGAVSLVHAVGTKDGENFVEHLRVILGMDGGRVAELWLDPGDRPSFAKNLA
ncbi:MAG: hypothetical protein ACT4QG_20300 [Sporichthyaceae bacterium]